MGALVDAAFGEAGDPVAGALEVVEGEALDNADEGVFFDAAFADGGEDEVGGGVGVLIGPGEGDAGDELFAEGGVRHLAGPSEGGLGIGDGPGGGGLAEDLGASRGFGEFGGEADGELRVLEGGFVAEAGEGFIAGGTGG